MAANDRQVGGTHYQTSTGRCPHCGGDIQHWDLYGAAPYLVGQVTKYATRQKNGVEDLEKAMHFLQKLAEVRYGVNLFEKYMREGEPAKSRRK